MLSYYQTQSAIVLLIVAIQSITISFIILSKINRSDPKYKWSFASILIGIMSILFAMFAFFHYTIPYFYQIWVIVAVFMNLIITVLGIVVFPSTNTLGIIGWTCCIILCIVSNAFSTYAVIPLSKSTSNTIIDKIIL